MATIARRNSILLLLHNLTVVFASHCLPRHILSLFARTNGLVEVIMVMLLVLTSRLSNGAQAVVLLDGAVTTNEWCAARRSLHEKPWI